MAAIEGPCAVHECPFVLYYALLSAAEAKQAKGGRLIETATAGLPQILPNRRGDDRCLPKRKNCLSLFLDKTVPLDRRGLICFFFFFFLARFAGYVLYLLFCLF